MHKIIVTPGREVIGRLVASIGITLTGIYWCHTSH